MKTSYGITGYRDIEDLGGGLYKAYGLYDQGIMTIDFDFDTEKFEGSDGDLKLSGTIDGNSLSGRSNYKGVGGTLRGGVDSDQTVGAFHGNNDSITYAGAFYGEAE